MGYEAKEDERMKVQRVAPVLNIADHKRKKPPVKEVRKRPIRPPDGCA